MVARARREPVCDPSMRSLAGKESALSFLRIAPNYRLRFGHMLDDEVLELEPWDAVRIARETVRNVEAGPEGAELILFGAPNSGPNDAEMLQNWWTD